MRLASLLAGALLSMPGAVLAVPRMELPPPEPETPQSLEARREDKVAAIAAWLPRIVGRFKYEGVVEFGSSPRAPPNLVAARGLGDCISLGQGPGVQCVLDVRWVEEWDAMGTPVVGGISFLGPAAMLYGIDANAAGVRYLMLDTDGLATDGFARLNGNTLTWTFEGYCPSVPQRKCPQTMKIYAPPDGKYVQTYIVIGPYDRPLTTVNLHMRRVPRDQASTPPPGQQ
jgi:hypothetical protein